MQVNKGICKAVEMLITVCIRFIRHSTLNILSFPDIVTTITKKSAGYFTSPYYPHRYDSGVKRAWKLIAPRGHKIKLQFIYMDIEESDLCDRDYITVEHIFKSGNELRVCGRTLPPPIISISNKLLVTFVSDKEEERTGFNISFAMFGKNNF